MQAVVVGGNGFIGTHLVQRLAALGWPTTVVDEREPLWGQLPAGVRQVRTGLTEPTALEAALRGAEVVLHLAWTSIHESSNRDPEADVLANLVPSLRLIRSCEQAGLRRLVFVSSGGTVYGPAQRLPIAEDHPTEPLSAYGIHKLAVEKHLQLAQHLTGLEAVIVRPSVAYGPGQSPFRRQGAVAVFLYRVARGLPVTLFGDGEAGRDYCYVADLVEALVAAAERADASPGVFNIGGAEEVSLRKLIAAVERTVGRSAEVVHEPARPFDAVHVALDTTRARATLGWRPRTELAEGLELTWDWLRRAFP